MRPEYDFSTIAVAALLVASTAVVSIGVAGVAAQEAPPSMTIRGNPDLQLHLPDNSVTPGRTNAVTIQVSNDGELDRGTSSYRTIVTTARNVRLEADADGTPLTVETGEIAIGTVTENEPVETAIEVTVPKGIDTGTYTIDVDLHYSHTYQQSGSDSTDRSRTERTEIEVRVEDAPRFSIVNATTDAPIGEEGVLQVALANVGSETAHNVRARLESTSQGLTFRRATADTGYNKTVRPGQTVDLEYDVAVAENARVRPHALVGTVFFEDTDGIVQNDTDVTASVTPLREQSFGVENLDSTLHVDEDGSLRATVVNDGPRTVRDPVAVLSSDNPNVEIESARIALPDLDVGESTAVDFDVSVGDGASAGMHQVGVAVEYTNLAGDRYTSDAVEKSVRIGPKRDRFAVEDVSADLRVNEEGPLEVTIVNNGSEAVHDPVAILSASNPNIHIDTPEYAFSDLAPGERDRLAFEVDVSSAMSASVQQFALEVTYTDDDGERETTDAIETNVRIGSERDRFVVEAINGSLPAGGSTALTLRVTNNGNETLRDIEAKAFLDDPLASDDDEALIPELAPGESEDIVFQVSASGAAMEKTYPLSVDFRYERPDGDTDLSRTYKVPVRVTGDGGGGLPIWIAVPILGVIILAGWQRERLKALLP